jgi:hypothetical protein
MNTHDHDGIDDRIKQLLQRALPPISPGAEPGRDLWPAVLRRLNADAAPTHHIIPARFSVPWFDWALLAGLVVFAVSFPATIPMFLYYL